MDPSPSSPPTAPQEGVSAPMSLAARLLNVFATPGEVFSEIKNATSAASNWVVPGLLLVLVGWVGTWLVFSQPAIRQQVSEMTEKQLQPRIEKAHLNEAQAEQMRKATQMVQRVIFVCLPVVTAFVFIWIWGLILWLAGKYLFRADLGYMKTIEMVGLSNMIAVLDGIVKTLLIIVTGNLFAAPSLTMLVKDFDPQNSVHGLLALFNLMAIWLLAVRSIGLARLAGVSFAKAAGVVFGVWIGYTGFFWGLGAVARKVFGH